jgi:chromosome segregation ATPase
VRQLEGSNIELQSKLAELRQAMSQVEEREEKYLLMIKGKNAVVTELEKKVKLAKTDSVESKRKIEELEKMLNN